MTQLHGKAVHITGVVQGVGFRPFVYNLALRHNLRGWVRNTSAGVDIRVDGEPTALAAFLHTLESDPPPLARIDQFHVTDHPPENFPDFAIRFSAPLAGAAQPISPDIAICADCLRELHDPADRRYRYPFINCTNCGPRFTIIQDIPYDRPYTTMQMFPMCEACAAEYHDPADRRFHAQPVACPDCGPQVWLEVAGERVEGDAAIQRVALLLRQGAILAIKGLGGFHLACDATNDSAVQIMRERKGRLNKPFALMMANTAQITEYCTLDPAEDAMLTSPASPIVLLKRRTVIDGVKPIAPAVAPRQITLGVMIPYTPLHGLLFHSDDSEPMPPLVMTSGNYTDEPIVITNDDARAGLADLADAFLFHDRDIHIRTDDSVMRVFNGDDLPIRRSRGYAPYPVHLPFELPPMLAVGGEMKNTFCVTRERYAFMSHHIGTMGDFNTLMSFEAGIAHFERLFRITPQIIAYDQHPDYAATRYALQRAAEDAIPAVAVQHHHAHVAACMAEHQLSGDDPVIGVCFDGTGYGTDGTIWGGEFLIADYTTFERAAHLKPLPLPGGDAATHNPYRIAYAYLTASDLSADDDLPPMAYLSDVERRIIDRQIERGINTPLTSSMGRLFDAVSSLIGVCQSVTYEGQGAIEFEAQIDPDEMAIYPLPNTSAGIDPAPLLAAVIADWRTGVSTGKIAAKFHNTLAEMIVRVCADIANARGLSTVVLTGGVFQNMSLLARTVPRLRDAGLTVYTHQLVPPNDGGIALGQAIIGYHLHR